MLKKKIQINLYVQVFWRWEIPEANILQSIFNPKKKTIKAIIFYNTKPANFQRLPGITE